MTPETSATDARTTRSRRLTRVTTGALLAAALASAAVACSSDDDATSSTTTGAGGHAHTVSAEACGAFAELSGLTFAMPEDPGAMPAFVEESMVPVVRTIVDGLPADHAAPGTTVLDAYSSVARTGSPEALEDPAVTEAQTEVGEVLFESCPGTKLEVSGVDYAFEGLPDRVEAGPTLLSFTDDGTEEHEIMVVKRNEGTEMTLDELLALPGEEAFAQVTPITVTWGGPGETSYTAMDLEPGTYFALCNIPIGGGEDGPPHHTAGMKQTFVVS